MRIFIALEFPNHVKDALSRVQDGLRPYCIKGNFSRKENLHLTLRFIGECTDTEGVKNAAARAASGVGPFAVLIKGLGEFRKRGGSIIWTGVQAGGELDILYSKLENVLIECGLIRGRERYSPHITLVREARLSTGVEEVLRAVDIPPAGFTAEGVSVMESTRMNGRLVYIRRHFAPFNVKGGIL